MKYLDTLFPETGGLEFNNDFWLKKYTLQHGPLSRLPPCLQPPDGSAVGLHCLDEWNQNDPFDIAVVDEIDYTQLTLSKLPPMAFYRLGAPVMLVNIHRRIPELRQWVTGVCNDLGVANDYVKVNGWFARQSNGLGVHYDPGEVILIQLVGTKRMRIGINQHISMPDSQYELAKPCSASELPLFANGFPEAEPENMHEIELRPGSVLAMPRGTWHDSLAMDTDSVALALFFRPPTVVDLVLPYLREVLRQDPKWRIPVGYSSENDEYKPATELIAQGLASLPDVIRAIHPEQVMAHAQPVLKRRQLLTQAIYTLQRSPEAKLSINRCTEVSRMIRVKARLNMSDTRVSQVELGVEMIDALEWVSNRAARFTIEDLSIACPDLSKEFIKGLVEVLLETNYLMLLPFAKIE